MCHSLRRSGSLFLKAINISGFKSFAQTARLELPAGITALVGPNGSGKSNVVDAIRWALGEQSMRDLRGARTEDVIHAGPRRSLGLAEVTLSFESRSISSAEPGDLSVTRRLYRSGDSEYLVNRQRGRLRDLQDALRSVGLDGSRYIVVNQGMTDALLTVNPSERRLVLEQAAGLSGYRSRRDEARQKLATTSQNLLTMEAVLAELEPRLRVLRRQSRAVQDRDIARSRLRERLAVWNGTRWTRLGTEIVELDAELNASALARDACAAELRRSEERADAALDKERTWRRSLDAVTAALQDTQREYDEARFAEREARRRTEAIEQRQVEAQTRGASIREALARIAERRESARVELDALQEERNASLAVLNETRAEVESRLPAAEESSQRRRAALTAREAAQRPLDVVQTEMAELQRELDGQRPALEESARATESARIVLADTIASLNSARPIAREALETAERFQAELLVAERDALASRTRLDRIERLRVRLRSRIIDLGRRTTFATRAFDDLGVTFAGSPLAGLSVAIGWEVAVAAALAPRLRGGKGSGEPGLDAVHRKEYLEWRDRLPVQRPEGIWADEVVDSDSPAVEPGLLGTLLVDDETAGDRAWRTLCPLASLRIGSPPVQVITRGGAVISAHGREAHRQDDRSTRYLRLKRELVTLGESSGMLERRLVALTTAHTGAVSLRSEHEEQLRARRQAFQSAAQARATAEHTLQDLERRQARASADQARWSETHETLTGAIAKSLSRVQEMEARVREARDGLSHAVQIAAEIESECQARDASVREARERLRIVQGRLDVCSAREEAQSKVVAAFAAEDDRLERDLGRLTSELETLAAEWERANDEVRSLAAGAESLGNVLREQRARMAEVRDQRPEEVHPSGDLVEVRKRLNLFMAGYERLASRLAQRREDREALRQEIDRELGVDPSSLPVALEDEPTEDEIRRLRVRANQYPDADLSVVEECSELEERYRRLSEHVQDLGDASNQLHEIMAVADAEMKERFAVALDTVNREFGRVFEVMLRGGSASLERVDADGGIGVTAQLPGKRARASAAYSGGERALVASSLLFGILRMRPTPFCVLDEVDAPLDESNVDRYLAALRDISRNTQVIVVTHNRATMAAAGALYGLTMDDEGVSKLLSLRLDAYRHAG